ncbi:MAG: hypothetical protein Q7U12_09520, partial [Undibacterium sp.]|nr:hypothetical protein [Undibacterium sp.]
RMNIACWRHSKINIMAVRVKIGRKCAFRILASMIHFIAAGWLLAGFLRRTNGGCSLAAVASPSSADKQ